MPPYDITFTAEFELIPPAVYTVTTTNGTTTPASATAVTTVNLVADSAPAGQIFDKWTTTPGVTFTDANSPNTSFTMPSSNVQITAPTRELCYWDRKWVSPRKRILFHKINRFHHS